MDILVLFNSQLWVKDRKKKRFFQSSSAILQQIHQIAAGMEQLINEMKWWKTEKKRFFQSSPAIFQQIHQIAAGMEQLINQEIRGFLKVQI